MTDHLKYCNCGCIYEEADCPNCNKVTEADRIAELEAKGLANRVAIMRLEANLAKKNGNLEETYRRWKNGADLRVLAKEAGCTQERIRLKLTRYENDKVRQLEAKLAKAVEALNKLTDCVDDGCFCSEMQMATAMEEAHTTLAELKGGKDE